MKAKKFKLILILVSILFAFMIFLLSPIFYVKNVNISGNRVLTTDEVKRLTGLDQQINVFAFNRIKAKKMLKKNHYVEDVVIETKFLSEEISIKIKERVLSGYVEYISGTFLYIDEEGVVLNIASFFTDALPIVVGLDFTEVTVGKPLEVKNKKSFDTLVILAHLFNKYGMGTDVIRVDVENPDEIHLYIDDIDVELGSIQDADEKVRTVKVIMERPECKDVKGFLDIKDITKRPRLRYLT